MDNARRRAAPMTPDERRAAIATAVMPLVAERGADVTSRELAQAAGVAEGTLFRAFGDKSALVGAVAVEGLHQAAGPEQTLAELAAIDLGLPLEQRLELVIEQGRDRMAEVMRWMLVLRHLRVAMPGLGHGEDGKAHEFRDLLMTQRRQQHEAMVEGITAVLAPDLHRLRVPVEVAISLIEAVLAGAHPRAESLLPGIAVDVLADALVNGLAEPARTLAEPTRTLAEPPKTAGSAAADGAPSSAGRATPGSPTPSPEGNS